ncbi:MAG: 23S rRNA (pseudouridine(1915)-N(3))-methyltransferase RlmH [Clostridium sp.]|nr:23S rRNA (pseudouridine(1915)-N(3))-methyltransferase RlmH [Clostridium sp.]MCM1398209.1 23S rRNA (pseudouridine(1915)-N(3))-methyltransferase RlmH [Clostridium sp.]MCM1460377.1 23S rRNA (pseudouridine(1915)-N(3))-methyltransferase RlmH [Bacteroides sp.]
MFINLIAVGSVKEEYFREKIAWYIKKIKTAATINLIEIPDEPIPQNAKELILQKIKQKEGERILEKIKNTDYVVALCIEGDMADGQETFQRIFNRAGRTDCVTFIIGGSLGLSEQVTSRADDKLSFSPMTFPHQLMRVMLLERLYAFTCDR